MLMDRRYFLKAGGLAAIAYASGSARAGDGEEKETYFTGIDHEGDKNNNKLHDLSEIRKVYRKTFGNDESVGIGAIVENREGKKLTIRVYDAKGRVAKEFSDIMGAVIVEKTSKWSVFHRIDAGELKPGEYTVGWKFNGFFERETRQKIKIMDIPWKEVAEGWQKREMEEMDAEIKKRILEVKDMAENRKEKK